MIRSSITNSLLKGRCFASGYWRKSSMGNVRVTRRRNLRGCRKERGAKCSRTSSLIWLITQKLDRFQNLIGNTYRSEVLENFSYFDEIAVASQFSRYDDCLIFSLYFNKTRVVETHRTHEAVVSSPWFRERSVRGLRSTFQRFHRSFSQQFWKYWSPRESLWCLVFGAGATETKSSIHRRQSHPGSQEQVNSESPNFEPYKILFPFNFYFLLEINRVTSIELITYNNIKKEAKNTTERNVLRKCLERESITKNSTTLWLENFKIRFWTCSEVLEFSIDRCERE